MQLVARGLALFFGVFGLINLLGDNWRSGFDENLWWLDLRGLAPFTYAALISTFCICLLVFAIRIPRKTLGRGLLSVPLLVLTAIATGNALNFYVLLAKSKIGSGESHPVPDLDAETRAEQLQNEKADTDNGHVLRLRRSIFTRPNVLLRKNRLSPTRRCGGRVWRESLR